jgi:hypothetical protein
MAPYVEVPATLANPEAILGIGIQDNENEIFVKRKLISKGTFKGPRKTKIPSGTWT